MTTVRAKYTATMAHPEGWPARVRKGQAFPADDPIVRAHPEAFVADNTDVEQATAAPGEKRTTKKPSKKSQKAQSGGDE